MRALIIASASLAMVIDPSSTCATNSFTRFLPRSLAAGSRARRPSSTIWSRRPFSRVCSVAAATAAFCGSLIGLSFRLGSHFVPELIQLLGVAYGIKEQFFQLVVPLQASAEVGKSGPKLQQLTKRLHLAGDL